MAEFMGKKTVLTPRVETLRARCVNAPSHVSSERARLVTEAYDLYGDEPVVVKRARALKHILENMKIVIRDNELIVGNVTEEPASVPIYPECAVDWLSEELDGNPYPLDGRPGDRFTVSDEVRRELKEIIPRWKKRTHQDYVFATLPEEIKKATEIGAINGYWLMHFGGEGHTIPGHADVLERGLSGIVADAESALRALDLTDPRDVRKKAFLEAVLITCDAAIGFASRYADLADTLAEDEKNPTRKAELQRIAGVCRNVPARPARDFQEALQSVYFTHAVCVLEDCPGAMSFGCMDRYLAPYYEEDLAGGSLTREEALELMECFLLKAHEEKFIMDWHSTEFFLGIGTFDNLTIGGMTATGEDASNEVSYLILEAQASIRLPWPILTARYHDGTPDAFLMACIDVISLGGGQPGIFSDEAIVPAFMNRGFPFEDAVEYGIVGCVEPHVGGKQANRNQAGPYISLLKILELTLNGGRDPRTGVRLCPDERDLSGFRTFDDLMEAYRKQLRYYQELVVINQHLLNLSFAAHLPKPFNSALVKNCIEKGRAISEGGALYDMIGELEIGYANVGNSLAAIRRLVFDDKVLPGKRLLEALHDNFTGDGSGPSSAEIRSLCLKAPKYGNGDPYVDNLVAEVQRFVSQNIVRYGNTRCVEGLSRACGYQPSSSTVSSNIPFGKLIGATPDGRRAGDATADGVSPHMGTDTQGPTGVAASISRLPNLLVSGGQLVNQKFSKTALAGEGKRKLADWIRTYEGDLKGMHVQFNVVDAETLREAQTQPDKHRELQVRVAGYTAFFTTLSPELQEVIISRTEQSF
jgi:pyruvate formate-lyase/glycerol dehydratase family glycyl radical enzyme